MNWKLNAKDKFNQGIKQMSEQSQNFIKILNQFNESNEFNLGKKITRGDLLPEGGMRLLKLKDGTEILAETCSYQIDNKNINYIWVEFSPQQKNIIIEVNRKDGESKKYSLLSGEVVEYYPDGL